MVVLAIIDSPQGARFRDLPVSEAQAPDGGSFCEARRRSQGRFIAPDAHAKVTRETAEEINVPFPKYF